MTHVAYSFIAKTFAVSTACFLVLFFAATIEAATVSNSVSVSANGGSQSSTVDVRTTINGEVVEDYHETTHDGSASYASQIEVTGDEVYISTSSSEVTVSAATEARYRHLLNLLEHIMDLLESFNR